MNGRIQSRSPWLQQLGPDLAPLPLDADLSTDVAVVGAGIAGVATAFFLLRDTDLRVLLSERDRAGRGATGRNGVGFLPSVYGGYRIARLLRGDPLPPSIFDPP